MRRFPSRTGWAVLAGIATLLAGCHAPPPPAPPVVAAPVVVPPPPPSAPEPKRYVASDWSFSTVGQTCAARTSHRALSFAATVGADPSIDLVMAGGPHEKADLRGAAAASLSFEGGSGTWKVRARIRGRTITAMLLLNQKGLDRLLSLLDGGRVVVRVGKRVALSLDVPDGGVAGRDWFACPRARLASLGDHGATSPQPPPGSPN